METVSIAYIDRLPNELLQMIFRIVYEDDSDEEERPGHPWISRILILRWVSRRFRFVVNDLDIWWSEDFILSEQFNLPNWTPFRHAQVVSTLLEDKSLVPVLSRRSHWRFQSVDVFVAMLLNVPEIRRNTQNIELGDLHVGLGFALERLSMFSCLITLTLVVNSYGPHPDPETTVNFDTLVRSCPLLEDLDISEMVEYRGSLEDAANLRNLCLDFQPRIIGLTITHELFPLKSEQKLSSFTIHHSPANLKYFHHELFEDFVNLTSFATTCLTPQYCNLLSSGKFTLTSLNITIVAETWETPSIQSVANVFSASSLKQLRILYFQVDYEEYGGLGSRDFPLDELRPVIYAITNLRYLESLWLRAGFKLSWCDRFAGLRNLKSLYFFILEPDHSST